MSEAQDNRPLTVRYMSPQPNANRSAEEPRADSDYSPIGLAEILALDLRGGTLLIDPSFLCDLRCTFCRLPVASPTAIDWDRVLTTVRLLAFAGLRSSVIGGGEPGLRPELPRILRDLREAGMRSALLTHGLWARSRTRLDAVLAEGLDAMHMSLKGFDRASFAQTTGRERSFDHQRVALVHLTEAWRDRRLRDLTLNLVLTRRTLPALTDAGLLRDLPAQPPVVLSLVEPFEEHMVGEVPAIDSLLANLATAVEAIEATGAECRFDGIPLCLLGTRWRASRDVARAGDRAVRILLKPGPTEDLLLIHHGYQRYMQFGPVAACGTCRQRGLCPGVHKRMHRHWDLELLHPLEET